MRISLFLPQCLYEARNLRIVLSEFGISAGAVEQAADQMVARVANDQDAFFEILKTIVVEVAERADENFREYVINGCRGLKVFWLV